STWGASKGTPYPRMFGASRRSSDALLPPNDRSAPAQPGRSSKPLDTPTPGPTGGVPRRKSRVRLSRRVVTRFRVYSRRAEYGTRFRYPNVGRRGAPRRQPRGGHPRAAGGESRWPGPERRERRAGGAEEQPVAVV